MKMSTMRAIQVDLTLVALAGSQSANAQDKPNVIA